MKKEILKQELLRNIRAMELRMLERGKTEEALGIPSSRKFTEQFIEEAAEVIIEEYVAKTLEERFAQIMGDTLG